MISFREAADTIVDCELEREEIADYLRSWFAEQLTDAMPEIERQLMLALIGPHTPAEYFFKPEER
jgi:hypothetical protein